MGCCREEAAHFRQWNSLLAELFFCFTNQVPAGVNHALLMFVNI
ncbi:MAG: hypothetical protein AVDCRST_MAG56-3026 [uncultured Cytophagales bacterium]|uniref:Uncharacterized protein n=1 Tax=uncultured Cytophagales bacterium TaxID=158755 RepID=A0A6J4J141_9SPHI|nr:MAG: hypothetical protein AVDCRST_MAG56-3026 [uncultured Cytophagales bacterium]